MSKQIRFFAFDFAAPAHLSSGLWRHPEDRGSEYKSVKYWVEYAKLLESACFDGIFFANNDGYHDKYKGSVDAALRDVAQIPADEPAYVISAMAAATQYLGFGVTSSTAYDQPYNLARKFATLDHLTDGRVAWNLVTSYSDSAARNLGNGTQREHDDRYGHAEEFIDVALKLWEGSWEENAVVMDRENCTYIEPSRVHEIQHEGEHFKVPGIFACEPSAQRTPVIFQAGGSPRGVAFAAATAEAVFLNASTKEALKKQVDNLREQATAAGRNPDHIATVQMITVIAGRTDEEAQQRYEDYKKLVSYEGAMARYSGWLNLDMSEYDPDVPLKDVKTNASQTMLNFFLKMDPSKEWTPRDIAEYNGIGGTSPVIVGGPEKVADELQAWVEETGVSGFNITHAIKYQDIKNFIDFAVPELQQRGLMRTEYDGPTLRENLFGKGQARLAGDHPGVKYRRNTSV